MKKILKTRYEKISNVKETIWRKRAKSQWIEGDKNTSIFIKWHQYRRDINSFIH
jgi:hypothetical protein